MEQTVPVKKTVLISLFTALTVVGGYIAIPLGPVPMVLSNFMILLSGALLGRRMGGAVAFTYLLLGLAGLPVFAGGTSGFAHLTGPTGGYLLAYLPAAFTAGAIANKGKRSLFKYFAALSAGALLIYAAGVPWLKFSLNLEWKKAVLAGMVPFLPGDLIKVTAAALIAFKMDGLIDSLNISANSEDQ